MLHNRCNTVLGLGNNTVLASVLWEGSALCKTTLFSVSVQCLCSTDILIRHQIIAQEKMSLLSRKKEEEKRG